MTGAIKYQSSIGNLLPHFHFHFPVVTNNFIPETFLMKATPEYFLCRKWLNKNYKKAQKA